MYDRPAVMHPLLIDWVPAPATLLCLLTVHLLLTRACLIFVLFLRIGAYALPSTVYASVTPLLSNFNQTLQLLYTCVIYQLLIGVYFLFMESPLLNCSPPDIKHKSQICSHNATACYSNSKLFVNFQILHYYIIVYLYM